MGSCSYFLRLLACVVAAWLLGACAGTERKDSPLAGRSFQLEDVAKSDVDMVAEVHLQMAMEHLRALTGKLYRRNPREWRKGGQSSVTAAVDLIFGDDRPDIFRELQAKSSVDSMRLAFDEGYEGDRVLALMDGLRRMVLEAYNGKQEFYLLDELDPQRLYNSARNIEVAVWKLSHDRDASGRLLLLTNDATGPVPNLSFERQFGKIIALQDSMAQIVADATNRRIKNVIQTVASSVFIGI